MIAIWIWLKKHSRLHMLLRINKTLKRKLVRTKIKKNCPEYLAKKLNMLNYCICTKHGKILGKKKKLNINPTCTIRRTITKSAMILLIRSSVSFIFLGQDWKIIVLEYEWKLSLFYHIFLLCKIVLQLENNSYLHY